MRRILVLRGGALGDFIVTLPALKALRERFPTARIELVGNATAAALALARGMVDAVHSQQEARWGELYSSNPLSPDFAQRLAAFDLVISFWPDPDRELAARFPLHSDQRFIGSVPHPASGPAAAHFLSALAAIALPSLPVWVRLFPLQASPCDGEKRPRTVVLHPGSGSPRKNWPLARWEELAAWLGAETTLPLEIISGPAEDTAPLSGLGTALRHRPLEELVGHLARCQLFIGHDSGISHLAAACGARCVLLFGPTNPEIWAPPTPLTTVVAHGSELQSLSLAAVQRAVRAALS
jgi:heptosyltransferase-2